jgi:hypothetical protein
VGASYIRGPLKNLLKLLAAIALLLFGFIQLYSSRGMLMILGAVAIALAIELLFQVREPE